MSPQENKVLGTQNSSTEEKSLCLILQTDTLQFIVPRVQVAEVVRYDSVTFSAPAENGVTLIGWRNIQVPLISTNLINPNSKVSLSDDSKVIILHGLLKHNEMPYYAIAVTKNPRLVEVYANTIAADKDGEALAPGELMHVNVDDEKTVIPRFEYLEKFILDAVS